MVQAEARWDNVEQEKKMTAYPCLKISDTGMVVLFIRPNTGVVVAPNDNNFPCGWGMGGYNICWNEPEFHIYNGKVVLQNTKE